MLDLMALRNFMNNVQNNCSVIFVKRSDIFNLKNDKMFGQKLSSFDQNKD